MDLVLHTDASYRNDLDTGRFARMLDDPSQCYKFYWLEAILNLMPTEEGNISFEKIIDEMICDAWYSVTRYKLHLGPTIRGKCENALERAINVINQDDQMSYASSKDEIMHGIEQHQAEIRAVENLYIPGNSEEQFTNILEHNLRPVYDAAKLQGYGLWRYTDYVVIR